MSDRWWSERWMKALAAFIKPRALQRGAAPDAARRVSSVRVDHGFAEASVQGSRRLPYKVEVGLPMLSPRQARRAADALLQKAVYRAKLLAGELPYEIAEIFDKAGASLFPASEADLSAECSCLSDDYPCAHIAAALHRLGREFDRDPFLLLEMRGFSRAQLLAEFQTRRAAAKRTPNEPAALPPPPGAINQTPLSATLNEFFDAPKGHPLVPDRPADFLAQLPPPGGRLRELGSPPFWQSDHDFQAVLQAIYLAVRKKTLPAG